MLKHSQFGIYIRKGCPPVQVLSHEYLLSAHAFVLKWDSMCTPVDGGVRIGSHFHKNAYMHWQTTIGIHEEEGPKLTPYSQNGNSVQ